MYYLKNEIGMGTEFAKKESQKEKHSLENASSKKMLASIQDNRPIAANQAILKKAITTSPRENQQTVLQKMDNHKQDVIPAQVMQFDFSDKQMADFRDRRKSEQNHELELLKERNFVTGIVRKVRKNIDKTGPIRVGVTFRTDARGKAHDEHDLAAVKGMNGLGLPFEVEAVSLPEGAHGEETPLRLARPEDLNGIDLLFIPGAPTANDTQTGDNQKEAGLNVPVKPLPPIEPVEPVEPESGQSKKYINSLQTYKKEKAAYTKKSEKYNADLAKYERIQGEHSSRSSYEITLIKFARTRGIPIIAFCAGSWRLLQAFGGGVETLPPTERAKHKDTNTWAIGHGVKIEPDTMLSSITRNKVPLGSSMTNVNSTHWAVASEENKKLKKRSGSYSNPSEELLISARASGTEVLSNSPLERNSVEAFESVGGAPVMGFQWHPEAYLPGMPGEKSGSKEAQESARDIFRFIGGAAHASAIRRRNLVREIREVVPEVPATHAGIGTHGITDAAHTDLPGRIFGSMAAEIEEQIDYMEAEGIVSAIVANKMRTDFRPIVERLILQAIANIERSPENVDEIIKNGIKQMQVLQHSFSLPPMATQISDQKSVD